MFVTNNDNYFVDKHNDTWLAMNIGSHDGESLDDSSSLGSTLITVSITLRNGMYIDVGLSWFILVMSKHEPSMYC
jgi:hypothetical protein